MSNVEFFTYCAIFVACFVVYFIPTIAAHCRKHESESAIGILNLLAGWSIVGWVAAFIWSFSDSSSGNESVDKIERLAALRDKGDISHDEFEKEKRKIIG
ncbi:superinfection immunity protein [Pseudomonas citronellolis]|uniref:superinfection immunity protein n=1 Tax=Pseudomonas citronellolis TaxID=53408 RepID=UPI002647E4F5|nr:superinfection immunity protein [Pseudomonas citronellolis]MDN6874079.1 superinfection immunity protein [Pseudomonas citronellolis]